MIISRAPVRISFGGGGTDLPEYYTCHGGFVVSAAIDRYCYVVADDRSDGRTALTSADCRAWLSFARGEAPAVEPPLALHRAALAMFAGDIPAGGIRLFTAAEVPPGTGLGSSSAMAAALVSALGEAAGSPMAARQVAELACNLEIDRLSMPIGKQDQYASAFGGFNAITFTADRVRVEPLRLPTDVISALENRLLLFSTGRTRDSSDILRHQRRDMLTDAAVTSSLHTIKRLGMEMRDALLGQRLDDLGRLLDEAWQRKKRLNRRISNGAIDESYAAAREAGALGGKITGAGGGGFLLLYCPEGTEADVRAAMGGRGLQEMVFGFDFEGARVIVPRGVPAEARARTPAAGAAG